MKQVHVVPTHLRKRTFLPGHGHAKSTSASDALPGVDVTERSMRRAAWMRNQSRRRVRNQQGGYAGLIGAAVVLLLTMAVSLTDSSSALERAALARSAAVVEEAAAPVAPSVIRMTSTVEQAQRVPTVRS